MPAFSAWTMNSADGRPDGHTGESAPLMHAKPSGTDLKHTAFNMINCFIGAGILTVPFAFRLAGYGAMIALGLVAAMNWVTSLLLGRALEKAAAMHPEVSLSEWDMPRLGRVAFGSVGQHLISMLFALELWFALETFIVLTGINMNLLTGVPVTIVIIFAGIVGTLSLSLPMSIIARFSFLSVWCMIGGLAALVVCGCISSAGSSAQHSLLNINSMPSAIGIFLYCFSGLPCLPNIRSAMHKPGQYGAAVHLSFSFAFLYYSAIGLLGYYFFGSSLHESFTENLAPTAGTRNVGVQTMFTMLSAGLFAMKLQSGFPLYAAPILGAMGCTGTERTPRMPVGVVRVMFAIVSITFAISAQDALDAVAELMGAFLTNFTSIIFPCAAYMAISKAHGERLSWPVVAGLVAMLVFGVIFSIIGTVSACTRYMAEERFVKSLLVISRRSQ